MQDKDILTANGNPQSEQYEGVRAIMRLASQAPRLGLDGSQRAASHKSIFTRRLLGWIDSKGSLSLSVILVSCLKPIRIKDWEEPHHLNTTSIPITMSPLYHLQHPIAAPT